MLQNCLYYLLTFLHYKASTVFMWPLTSPSQMLADFSPRPAGP